MDFIKYFSYCKFDETPESEHQFHYHKENIGDADWENWLISKLYMNINITKDQTLVIEKKISQLKAFLDYHFYKYNGNHDDYYFNLKQLLKLVNTHKSFNIIKAQKDDIDNYIIDTWIKNSQIEYDYKHYIESTRTPFALPNIDGYLKKKESELNNTFKRLIDLLNNSYGLELFNNIKYQTIEQFNNIIKLAKEKNKPLHEHIFTGFLAELTKLRYDERFNLSTEQLCELKEKTKNLTDEEKLNILLDSAKQEAIIEFSILPIEIKNNLKEPEIRIYNKNSKTLDISFKEQLLNEFNNPYVQNNIFEISKDHHFNRTPFAKAINHKEMAVATRYFNLLIDWNIWELWQNGIPESKNDSQIIPFPKYLKHTQKNELAELLKKKFAGKKGKKIALLISELTKRKLILIEYRERSVFIKSMQEYFSKSIGTNSGINKYLNDSNDYYNSNHKSELEIIELEIDSIIKDLENK